MYMIVDNVNPPNKDLLLFDQVSKPQRDRVYRIIKKFNHLAAGVYPFALEMTDDGERLIDEKEFEEQERNLRIEVNNIYTNILLAP